MFEKVNPQHPDKVADRIAGAIVDLAYAKSENPKVAAEVLLGHGLCSLQIETSERLTAEVLSPLWPLGLWTLATNGTQEGGGSKAGVLRRAKRQSRAEIKQAA